MDNFVFLHGRYKGKTYKYVRTNHIDYFIYLLSKPAGKVYNEFEFIKYCIDYLKTDSSPPPPPKKDYDKIIHQLCNSLMQKNLLLAYKISDKEYKIKYNYEDKSYDAWDISLPEYKFCIDRRIEKLITKINNNTPDPDFAKKVIIKLPNGDKTLEELEEL
jgi:hypothetical protein